jgi:hypothetical protein
MKTTPFQYTPEELQHLQTQQTMMLIEGCTRFQAQERMDAIMAKMYEKFPTLQQRLEDWMAQNSLNMMEDYLTAEGQSGVKLQQ